MRLPDMNHKKIQRIMRKYRLTAMVRKKNPYKQMMKKSLEHRTFPNKLQREFHQILPFKVFCTDITYITFLSRFAYLSVIKDIASGEVVAWNLSLSLEVALVTETVKNIQLDSYENIMIHSDQGFHYTNPAYIEIVKELKKYDQSLFDKPRWLVLNKLDVVPQEQRAKRVKDFVKRFGWKGRVFEISALTHEGCADLVVEIYDYLAQQRQSESRAEETQMVEEARGIVSIDPDDPRFKVIE